MKTTINNKGIAVEIGRKYLFARCGGFERATVTGFLPRPDGSIYGVKIASCDPCGTCSRWINNIVGLIN